jgi:hypothetical protein
MLSNSQSRWGYRYGRIIEQRNFPAKSLPTSVVCSYLQSTAKNYYIASNPTTTRRVISRPNTTYCTGGYVTISFSWGSSIVPYNVVRYRSIRRGKSSHPAAGLPRSTIGQLLSATQYTDWHPAAPELGDSPRILSTITSMQDILTIHF